MFLDPMKDPYNQGLQNVQSMVALANGGLFAPLRFLPSDPEPAGRRAQSPETAFLIADILSDRQARSVTFGLENPLATRIAAAPRTPVPRNRRNSTVSA